MLGKLRLLLLPAIAAGALLVPAAGAAAASCAHAHVAPSPATEGQVRSAILCLLNVERRKRGLKPLREDARLRKAAERHSRNMVDNSFFNHVTPAGTTMVDRVRKAGYLQPGKGWALGENIAWGTGALARPKATMRAWMRSPGHRANILRGEFREVGIGIDLGAPKRTTASGGGATYTTNFGVLL